MSCSSSEKYYFQDENTYFKLKIKEKHEIDKLIYEDNKTYHYDIYSIQSNKYQDFSVYLLEKSIVDKDRLIGCEKVYEKKRNFYKIECCEGENVNCYEFIEVERKIRDKFIVFYIPLQSNDTSNVDFMVKKLNKIKIRTNP